MKRKVLWFVIVFLFVFLTGLSTCAQGETAEKPYKSVVLRVVGCNHPWMESLMSLSLIPEFEEQTGMKVELENYGEDQLNQKLMTEFVAGSSDIDVFMQRPLQEARVMQKNGWYVDLREFTETDKEYDFADFAGGAVDTETVNGVITGIPIVTEQEVLYYRKDLFKKADLKPPTTLEEMMEAAKVLTNPDKEIYGFVARGQRSPLVTQFSSYLYSFGGDFFDIETGTATLDTPEALKAIDFYGTMLREYGPPGVLNMSWPQAVAVFAQGKAAMYTDASSIFPNLLDPKKSGVADSTGVIVFPSGPAGSKMYNVTAWGLSIYSGTKKKEAAWEFVCWATSKEITLKIQGKGMVPGARESVWANPEGTNRFPADWVKAVAASADGKGYDRPLVTSVTAARDIIGNAVVTAIEGGDYVKAVKQANVEFQKLIDSEK